MNKKIVVILLVVIMIIGIIVIVVNNKKGEENNISINGIEMKVKPDGEPNQNFINNLKDRNIEKYTELIAH